MLLAGFQRREKKFASFPELVATINKVRTCGHHVDKASMAKASCVWGGGASTESEGKSRG